MVNEAENINPEKNKNPASNHDVDSSHKIPNITQAKKSSPLNSKEQIHLKKKGDLVYITLPSTRVSEVNEWERIIDDFKTRLQKIEKSWQPETKIHLDTQDRLLDVRQLAELKQIFEKEQLKLDLVITKRRQTAVFMASAGYSVQQESNITLFGSSSDSTPQDLAEPLYLKNTIRSGVEISHPSTIIVFGDVNPGASIVAGGDVYVWGNLKGIAHAGCRGNREALIMALRMSPTQLRIADLVARAPDNPPDNDIAEVAYISQEGIRIRRADNFTKVHLYLPEKRCWVYQYNSELKFEKNEDLKIVN
jgi:septum site-determining protein MinC